MNQTWCLWLCDASHAWETRAGMALNGAVGRPGGDDEDEDSDDGDDGDDENVDDGNSGDGDRCDSDRSDGDSGDDDCVFAGPVQWQDLVVGK